MNQSKISVIIPVLNEADKIEQCLKAVFSQSLKPYEVIVVDGHSTDGTTERVAKFPIKILYEGYRTRGGACQIGVEGADSEFIAFTDADCIPDKDWLANLAKGFNTGVIGVGGAIINVERSFWERAIGLAMNTLLGGANTVQARLFKTQRFVKSISGCNSMYRRSNLIEVGGFKTSLPGAEDLELNGRLLEKGKLLYIPDAFILHDHGRGLKQFVKKMYRYGADRGVARVLNLQVVPSLFLPLILLSFIVTPWVVPGLLALYALVTIVFGLRFAIQNKNLKYLVAIPFVYTMEHASYTIGFWKGLITRKI